MIPGDFTPQYNMLIHSMQSALFYVSFYLSIYNNIAVFVPKLESISSGVYTDAKAQTLRQVKVSLFPNPNPYPAINKRKAGD